MITISLKPNPRRELVAFIMETLSSADGWTIGFLGSDRVFQHAKGLVIRPCDMGYKLAPSHRFPAIHFSLWDTWRIHCAVQSLVAMIILRGLREVPDEA